MKKGIVIIVLMLLFGCAGTSIDWTKTRTVTLGINEQQLIEIMGNPTAITTRGAEHVWVYTYFNGFTGSWKTVSFIMIDGKVISIPSIPIGFK